MRIPFFELFSISAIFVGLYASTLVIPAKETIVDPNLIGDCKIIYQTTYGCVVENKIGMKFSIDRMVFKNQIGETWTIKEYFGGYDLAERVE